MSRVVGNGPEFSGEARGAGIVGAKGIQDQRAAAIMSLILSASLNGHDPYAYLKDVRNRPPTQPASRVGELLPH